MKRGYIRKIKGRSADAQRDVLHGHDVPVIYEGDGLDEAIASLREGDQLAVAGGLHILANNRKAVRAIVDQVHAQGATVFDISTGRDTARDGVAMLDDAVRAFASELRFGDARDAGKLGAKARWAEMQIKRMDEDEARAIWNNTSLTLPEALDKMTGWNRSTAYRLLGAPNRPAGRRRGKANKRGKGRIYFARNGHSKRIKIGYSTQPLQRLRDMQVAHDKELELLLVMDGTRRDEKKLHRQFEHCRARGEWFEPCDELMEFITAKAEEK